MLFLKKIAVLTIVMVMIFLPATGQSYTEFPLYDKIPDEKTATPEIKENTTNQNGVLWVTGVTKPTLRYYAPSRSNTGAAVIICPGGGYAGLAISHEGYDVAKKFSEMGVSAFVLKYRLPDDRIMVDKKIGPLQDAQQAIKYVRENARKYHINSQKIGIMGFSAGGHLASTASTHFNDVMIDNKEGTSVRPDFSILIYPVITFGEFTHKGSRDNLIGPNPDKELIDFYSNEKQVTPQTPVTFMVQANDDNAVPVMNILNYIKALNAAGVKNEAHIYPAGGHGFGLNNRTVKDKWFDRLTNWMDSEGLLKL